MAQTSLLTDQTSDTTSSGVAVTGPATVFTRGLGGAKCTLEVAPTDTEADYEPLHTDNFPNLPQFLVNLAGSYYIRAKLENSTASTSANVIVSN